MDEKIITQEQAQALLKFWRHMYQRIARDANIQYYCGALTETLRLAVDVYAILCPEADASVWKKKLLESKLSGDADVCRLKRRIEELEAGS